MAPWYKGYTGKINPAERGGGFTTQGKYEVLDENTLRITELPIKKWTREYKTFLETMLVNDDSKGEIQDIKEYHTSNTVDFVIRFVNGKLRAMAQGDGIEKKFKLASALGTSNMVLFNKDGKLKKYGSVTEIMEEFYNLRLDYYEKRKEYILSRI